MLAGGNGLLDRLHAAVGRLGVEIDRIVRIGQRLVEIGGPAGNAGLCRKLLQFSRIAADQNRVGHDDFRRRRP